MESLPTECVPALGTEGETYRRRQCFLQVPLYDFSLDACHQMTDLETKRYTKITTKRRENSFGIGALKLQSTEDDVVWTHTHTHTHTHTYTNTHTTSTHTCSIFSPFYPQVCTECLQQITLGSVYISSERAGSDKQWHPHCFRCIIILPLALLFSVIIMPCVYNIM